MNGRMLAVEAAALRPALPILFTTGYARNAIVHNGQLDADVQFLPKPYTQQDLAQKLRAVLDARAKV
jgi:CheY-like chemotaxis protein